ncbi:MAG: NADH-quinone oxidoreductase subunit K [Candidatus Baltobacteraceae bacterium]
MNVELLVLLAGAVLIVSARTVFVLAAYAVLAVTASLLIFPSVLASPVALAFFVVTTLMKVVVAPLGVILFVRGNPTAADLRPSLTLPLRLLLAIGFALVSAAAAHIPALSAIPLQRLVAYVVLCGVGTLIVHRNVLSHILGLLVLGAGVTLAGAALAPQLPESIELGATFDALVGTFIGLALIREFATHHPALDVESLKRLRG